MSLKKYLEDLEPAKREVLLGRETKDALHEPLRQNALSMRACSARLS